MIDFIDVLKGKFLEEFSAISVGQMFIALVLSFVLSLFIVFIYRTTYKGVSFNRSFAGCLIMITLVTTLVILVITSNIILSLGMVGALSIVRFRTAVKEPSDTAYLFWAVATGIVCGAGYVTVAILATLLVGLLILAVHFFGKKQKTDSYMVVARFDGESETENLLAAFPGYRMKNKTMSEAMTELVAEMRLGEADMEKLSELRNTPGVREITVMRSVSNSIL